MNQDTNNENQNDFNLQDNNGIINNQPLQNNQRLNNTNNLSKQHKKMSLCLIIGIGITSSKKDEVSKEEATRLEQTSISKDEFLKIENQYLQSDNIFNIENITVSASSGNKVVVTGTGKKGNFSPNDIVEFIDQHGKLRKVPIIGIEAFRVNDNTVKEGDYSGILLPSINKDDLFYSGIIFKNEIYNGIDVSINYTPSELEKIEKYFNSNTKFDITINDTVESATIVTYYNNNDTKAIHLYLILNSNNVYSFNDKVKINDLNISGEINNLLR